MYLMYLSFVHISYFPKILIKLDFLNYLFRICYIKIAAQVLIILAKLMRYAYAAAFDNAIAPDFAQDMIGCCQELEDDLQSHTQDF